MVILSNIFHIENNYNSFNVHEKSNSSWAFAGKLLEFFIT
jgi:hypothetical protein